MDDTLFNEPAYSDLLAEMGRVTDAPSDFLKTACISLYATCLGKRVQVPFAGRLMSPSLWFCIVAKSTHLRKTSTLELIRRVFAEILGDES